MKLDAQIETYKGMAIAWLEVNTPTLTRYSIYAGRDAWTVAHNAGITRHAYAISRDITDGHIQTALERIFPNAAFLDRKVY
jgi:hypothetical protein